jgi:hypothetical protein
VVYEPALGLVIDVFPCEDGHAQERALLVEGLPTIRAGELWLHDRNFCTREFLGRHVRQGAFSSAASISNCRLRCSVPGAQRVASRRVG